MSTKRASGFHGMKVLSAVLAIALLSTSLIVAGGAQEVAQSEGDSMRVALLLVGSINDAGWSESSYRGYEKARLEYGFDSAYTENLQLPDMESAIRDYAERGFDVIVMTSADFSEMAVDVAPDYPEIKFIIVNGQQAQEPNLANFRPNTPECGFIAGAFSGLISESNVVGVIAGKKFPPVVDATNGFIAGAQYVNPDVKVLQAYIDSWVDIAKGTEASVAMIEQGADVLCSNTGQAAFGTIDAAREHGIYAVGYVDDQHAVAPGTVPFSSIQDIGDAVYMGIRTVMENQFKPEVVLVGAAAGVIRLSDFYTMGDAPVPADVVARMEEIYAAVVDGSLKDQGILPKSGFEK
ncbi:MAG: BMP family protein [Sphaerochaetaceae bacterium]|nr:BMP family protein [Sphaerochaetaceae bacterium]